MKKAKKLKQTKPKKVLEEQTSILEQKPEDVKLDYFHLQRENYELLLLNQSARTIKKIMNFLETKQE